MQVLTFEQIENVSGGTAENVCIAAVTGIGGLAGGFAAGYFSAGTATMQGFYGGALVGGLLGGSVCGYFFD